MYEARQNKEKVSRRIDGNKNRLKPDLNNGIELPKGSPSFNSSWVLSGRIDMPIEHSNHHIINFGSFLKPWFKTMSSAYNYNPTLELNNNEKEHLLKGRRIIRNIMTAVGVSFESGKNLSNNSQPNYTWRPGNIFTGIASKYRKDDPKDRNEWETTKTAGAPIEKRMKIGKSIYEEMNKSIKNIDKIYNDNNDDYDNSGTLRSYVNLFKEPYITDDRNYFDNRDWTCAKRNEWGSKAVIYYLRNSTTKHSINPKILANTVLFINISNESDRVFMYGCRYCDIDITKLETWSLDVIKQKIINEKIVDQTALVEAGNGYNLGTNKFVTSDDKECNRMIGFSYASIPSHYRKKRR